jgi:hypothetical protein
VLSQSVSGHSRRPEPRIKLETEPTQTLQTIPLTRCSHDKESTSPTLAGNQPARHLLKRLTAALALSAAAHCGLVAKRQHFVDQCALCWFPA